MESIQEQVNYGMQGVLKRINKTICYGHQKQRERQRSREHNKQKQRYKKGDQNCEQCFQPLDSDFHIKRCLKNQRKSSQVSILKENDIIELDITKLWGFSQFNNQVLMQNFLKRQNKYKYIVLASSGSNMNGQYGKKIYKLSTDHSQNQMTKSPLAGIDIDIQHIKQMADTFKIPFTIIESSKYKNCLLSREKILQKIFKQFSSASNHMRFFFTGHGYFNGAMCIQTKENPDGEPLYLEQIYDLMMKINYSSSSLMIYLDCCYSGKMAARLKNNRKPSFNVIVFCSSGPSHQSLDVNHYGGLLICGVWSLFLKNYLLKKEKEQLRLKFYQRLPIAFYSIKQGGEWKWSELQEIKHYYQ